ncbi:hypothetical protein MMC19_001848 [Ptychographa xylographoides]|nr:hypothetical protein [Ptychographa xylographoides]
MAGFAGAALAIAVTQANGMGFIGADTDTEWVREQLVLASKSLSGKSDANAFAALPVGLGFLLFLSKLETAARLVEEFRPAAVWLAGAHGPEHYVAWAHKMRDVSPETKIWIQVGSVGLAVALATQCGPDVLVMQGLDAGGHGWAKGAGVISLVPETADALAVAGFGDIPLVAAGGMVDGRGVAAAVALGAQGVVMGTRFLSSPEVKLPHKGYQNAILAAVDGGQNTVRAKVFDELRGPNVWPDLYDGRGVVTESYTDWERGVGIEELRRLHQESDKGLGKGFEPENRRKTVWAGTGVGLVRDIKGAQVIVAEVREMAREVLEKAMARL